MLFGGKKCDHIQLQFHSPLNVYAPTCVHTSNRDVIYGGPEVMRRRKDA